MGPAALHELQGGEAPGGEAQPFLAILAPRCGHEEWAHRTGAPVAEPPAAQQKETGLTKGNLATSAAKRMTNSEFAELMDRTRTEYGSSVDDVPQRSSERALRAPSGHRGHAVANMTVFGSSRVR